VAFHRQRSGVEHQLELVGRRGRVKRSTRPSMPVRVGSEHFEVRSGHGQSLRLRTEGGGGACPLRQAPDLSATVSLIEQQWAPT
jgi:hypothetical protein